MFTKQKILNQIQTTKEFKRFILFSKLNERSAAGQNMYGSAVEKQREMCSTPEPNYQKFPYVIRAINQLSILRNCWP